MSHFSPPNACRYRLMLMINHCCNVSHQHARNLIENETKQRISKPVLIKYKYPMMLMQADEENCIINAAESETNLIAA